jgi:hypothetical protein
MVSRNRDGWRKHSSGAANNKGLRKYIEEERMLRKVYYENSYWSKMLRMKKEKRTE